jgi:hypothetical protein
MVWLTQWREHGPVLQALGLIRACGALTDFETIEEHRLLDTLRKLPDSVSSRSI